jgi:hypothetical protein
MTYTLNCQDRGDRDASIGEQYVECILAEDEDLNPFDPDNRATGVYALRFCVTAAVASLNGIAAPRRRTVARR